MHRVYLQPLIHVADAQRFAPCQRYRGGRGEPLSIDRETERPVVEHDGLVDVNLGIARIAHNERHPANH